MTNQFFTVPIEIKQSKKSIFALVEVIAKRSQNLPWVISIDSEKQIKNELLRRISIDKFYEIVTNDKYAFKKLCEQLPITISKIISRNKLLHIEQDSVFQELKSIDQNILLALYKIAFKTYEGFDL
ncbi:Eco47II family restriction endonuclease [Mycoplasmopsis hyopharyngis]|uniref:Eco47II family restriction endonuclease n=1 Tax=Mycoplasmopsis hyopharyngis TaxID=29558 RepID=UPI003873A6B7